MNSVMERAKALQRARDRARNPEFKELWNKKLIEFLSLHVSEHVSMTHLVHTVSDVSAHPQRLRTGSQ
jgi:hypothetical protein